MLTTEIAERAPSIPCSFSDIDDPNYVGFLLERELLFTLVMNGVRRTDQSLREVSMDPALVVLRQQSIEVGSWSRIERTDRCPRCSGLMVAEWCEDLSDYSSQRCVQCGELIDPVIIQNRRLLHENTFKGVGR